MRIIKRRYGGDAVFVNAYQQQPSLRYKTEAMIGKAYFHMLSDYKVTILLAEIDIAIPVATEVLPLTGGALLKMATWNKKKMIPLNMRWSKIS